MYSSSLPLLWTRAEPCGLPFELWRPKALSLDLTMGCLSLSWQMLNAAALTCGSDYVCAASTDTVLPDVVCATDECIDSECCEPGERPFILCRGALLSRILNKKTRDHSFDCRVDVVDRVLVFLR